MADNRNALFWWKSSCVPYEHLLESLQNYRSVSLGPEFFDPSFSPVAMWWQKGGARIGLYAETWQHQVVFFKVLPMWTADESLLFRLALGPELGEKFWAIAGNRWKLLTLPETWWLISLSDETYPLITMTTISYYWLVSDHNWWAVESTISNIIFSPQGLEMQSLVHGRVQELLDFEGEMNWCYAQSCKYDDYCGTDLFDVLSV